MTRKIEKITFLLIISSIAGQVFCEIFSAIGELERLALSENELTETLENVAKLVNDDYVNRKLSSWQKENQILKQDINSYITNPLNAFLLIKRGTADLDHIKQRLPESLEEVFEPLEGNLPRARDLSGAVAGLIRLQTIYKMKSVDFANGVIDGKKTREPLSAEDLFTIGMESYEMDDEDFFAQEYLNLAWDLLKAGNDSNEDWKEKPLLLKLTSSYNRTGDYGNALRVLETLIRKNPELDELKEIQRMILDDQEKYESTEFVIENPFSDVFEKTGEYSQIKEDVLYSRVCRGNLTQSLKVKSKLFCRYVSNTPFAKLARFKVEELNLEPYIISFIDVVTDDEIEFLQNITKPISKPGKTLSSDLKGKVSNKRIAQLAWHSDEEHPQIAKISQRVEDMTGLSQKTAEELQVQNYGVGGHYVPHWDHRTEFEDPFPHSGNRIATMLFYLTDVEKGGATVFPFLKLRIPARKGSAAFWYNLKSSGHDEYATFHAGCPVVLGSKWVANKWIREHGQEFRRPCLPGQYTEQSEKSYLETIF